MVGVLDFAEYVAKCVKAFTGREWVFAEIDRWLADPEGPTFFLITGEPGVGKSAMAARLTQVRKLAAYHFCIARDVKTIDPVLFTRSIAFQLCQIDAFAQEVLKESKVDLNIVQNVQENYGQVIGSRIETLVINAPSGMAAFTHAVLQPLGALYAEGFEGQLVLLVDALDEAVQCKGMETIVDLLANAGPLPQQVRVVLTSRPEGAVLRHFEEGRIPHLRLDAGRPETLEDIRRYTQAQVATDQVLRARLVEQKMTAERFVERVTRASQGNFLYVVWLLPAIAGGRQPFDTVEVLPQGLDEIYREFLRTRSLGQEIRQWRYYRPLLGILMVAQQPLSARQLAQFAGTDAQSVADFVIDAAQFLDPTSSGQGQYQLYHQSVADFLKDQRRAGEFWIAPIVMERKIADYYLNTGRVDGSVAWGSVDDYGLLYLATHLSALVDDAVYRRQLYQLIEEKWIQAKLARFDNPTSLLRDIDLVLVAAWQERPVNLPQLIHCCLLYTAYIGVGPPLVIDVLARTGQLVQARIMANNILFAVDRCRAFALLCEVYASSGEQEQAMACFEEAQRTSDAIGDSHRAMALDWLVEAALALSDQALARQLAHQVLTFALTFDRTSVGPAGWKDEWDQPNALFWAGKALRYVKDQEGLTELRHALIHLDAVPIRNLYLQAMSVVQDVDGLRGALGQLTAWLSDPMAVRNLSNLALALADAKMEAERDQVFGQIEQLRAAGAAPGPADAQRRYVWALALAGQFDLAFARLTEIDDPVEKAKALAITAAYAAGQGAVLARAVEVAETLSSTDDWRVLSYLARVFLCGGQPARAKSIAERVYRQNVAPSVEQTLTMPGIAKAPAGYRGGKYGKRPLRNEVQDLEDERLRREAMAAAVAGEWSVAEAMQKKIQVPVIRVEVLLAMAKHAPTGDEKLRWWIEALFQARLVGRACVEQGLQVGKERLGLVFEKGFEA